MKKLITILCLSIFFSIFIISSCKKETEKSFEMGYNFFPVEKGNYITYKVDSVVWDDYTNTVIPYSYKVKIVIGDTLTDNEGRLSNWRKKYIKTDTTDWTLDVNSIITKTNQRVEIQENNIRNIKVIFPVVEGSNWNTNAMNENEKMEASYTDLNYQKGTFDSCCSVVYESTLNLVQEISHKEEYAKNIGMIYMKVVNKETQGPRIKGYTVEYNIIDYGKN